MTGSEFDRPGGDWQALLEERLLGRRIIVVNGRLDDRIGSDLASRLMYLDAMGDGPVTLRLSSPGGTLDAALSVIDVIDAMGVPVHVTASGFVEGAAVGLLAVAHRRVAGAHTRIRLSEEPVSFAGDARSVEAWSAAYRDQLHHFAGCIARRSRHPVAEILTDLDAGRYLNPDEAVAYGLIDMVDNVDRVVRELRPNAETVPLGYRPTSPLSGPDRRAR